MRSVQQLSYFARLAGAVAVGAFLLDGPAFSETPKLDKRTQIKEIIVKANLLEDGKLGIERMMPFVLQSVRQRHPEMTAQQTQALTDIIKATVNDQTPFIERISIDAYDETFSADEISALYDFYQTAVGSGIAAKLGAVQQRVAQKAQLWGQSILVPELYKRLKASETLKDLAE